MSHSLKSIAAGILSGAFTCAASIYALAHTNAFVMPRGFPLALWEVVVVFGLGAAVVAFLIHFFSIWMLAAKSVPAFISFAGTVVVVLATTGLLVNGGTAITSWLVGALLASLVRGLLRSNPSFKQTREKPRAA